MRKVSAAAIVFLAGTAVCLCGILVLLLSGGAGGSRGAGGNGPNRDYVLALEKEVVPGGISSLEVDYGMNSNDVYFYQGEGATIVIREYMNFTPEEKQISGVEEKEGSLLVKGARRSSFGFFSFHIRDAYTEIYLPGSLAGQLEAVSVKTAGGEIISHIPLAARQAFRVSSTSGDFCFPEIKAGEVQAGSTSGDIQIEALMAVKASVSSTSGEIGLGRAESDMDISSTSGNATLGQVKGYVQVTTTSGDISLGEAEGDTDISSTSGNATLGQVKGNVQATTTSGDISLGEVEGDMDVSSTSGNVRLGKGTGRFGAETSSGDIWLEALDGSFRLGTASGDVSLAAGNGWGTAETLSGDVALSLGSLDGDVTVSTTSGNVDIALPGTASFTLEFDSVSGGCSTFFDEQVRFNKKGNQAEGKYGSGDNAVRVSTSSGDLSILQ